MQSLTHTPPITALDIAALGDEKRVEVVNSELVKVDSKGKLQGYRSEVGHVDRWVCQSQ